LIDLTPKSGRSKEGDSVADSWELKFHRYVLYRELAWSVLNDHDVIFHLEYGTEDHEIMPKIARALHWIDRDTGKDQFSTGHVVSGIKPGYAMVRKTEVQLQKKIRDLKAKTALKIKN